MKEDPDVPSVEQQMYWDEFVQLKADACYIQNYRSSLDKWVNGLAALKSITSVSSIGGWLVWKQYAHVWASLIALSTLADALKSVFPVYKRRRALSGWSRTLNRLFIETQRTWDEIASGQYTKTQIRKSCHNLRVRKNRAEAKFAPEGLAKRTALFEKAQSEADAFFRSRYSLVRR